MDESFAAAMRALLHPRSIAIVGASPSPGWASGIQGALVAGGYGGKILPVNPNYQDVLGLPAFPSLDAIDGPVDLAIVVVPNRLTFDVLDACERKGVGAVNLIASGFGELSGGDEGAERQQRLRAFAARTGIRIAGPNCLGNVSTASRMMATWGPYEGLLPRGPVAAVFQSGLLSYSLVAPLVDRGIGFRYVVTSGNEADLETSDFIRWFVEDEETRVIAAFVEQFHDPRKLLEVAALAAERRKPIVVLKVGRSEGARRAALAHTGSLVGSDDVIDAVMRQHGIVRVDTLDEMHETLAIFHMRELPLGDGIASAFISGGAAGLVSDFAERLELRHPPLAAATRETLVGILPAFGNVDNPLDLTGQLWAIPGGMERAMSALAEDPAVDVILYGRPFPSRMDVDPAAGEFPDDLPQRYPDKRFVVMALTAGRHREYEPFQGAMARPADALDEVPFLQGVDHGLLALRSLLRYAAFQRERQGTTPPEASGDDAAARERLGGATGPLVEREAKALLAGYGIPVTREVLACDAEAAVAAAGEIGYPVVLKVESPDIAHKTEAGGVLLDIGCDEAVREGFTRIIASAQRYNASARISGVLVQQQVPRGHELILGMTSDPDFGPVIAVGLGGVFVETLRDVQLGVPPLSERDAREMLRRLRAWPVLEGSGARGGGAADIDALVEIIVRFGALCHTLRDEVAAIDINPLVVLERGRGACVVDALIVPRGAEQRG